jgi:hypothetical protein
MLLGMNDTPTILLIEDDEGIAEPLIFGLRSEGMNRQRAPSGAQGLALARSVHPPENRGATKRSSLWSQRGFLFSRFNRDTRPMTRGQTIVYIRRNIIKRGEKSCHQTVWFVSLVSQVLSLRSAWSGSCSPWIKPP